MLRLLDGSVEAELADALEQLWQLDFISGLQRELLLTLNFILSLHTPERSGR